MNDIKSNEYMIGGYKFTASSDEEALKIAKEVMFSKGWRGLGLMRKYNDGWGLCKFIPSFEQ